MVALQIRAVCEGFPVAAAKTGMLYSKPIIRAVAAEAASRALRPLVVDPVMVATSGARLLREDALSALRTHLLPIATVVTPNLPEAELLCGHAVASRGSLREAAGEIAAAFGTACVVKGGHLVEQSSAGGGPALVHDVLCVDGTLTEFSSPRVEARETHGTGCTFSAALAAFLAMGRDLAAAVAGARDVVAEALRHPYRTGDHWPLGPGPGRGGGGR
jgi:hydroxymethylpyrimidine kinase/phosphomethylpyrimidine kinase